MNLTLIQKIAITMAVLGVLSTSGVQLTDILGSGIAKSVVSVSGLINSVLAAIVAVISGQSAIIKQVASMPGVERVSVNADANVFIDVNLINKKHVEQVAKLKKEIETLNATVTHLNSKIEDLEGELENTED